MARKNHATRIAADLIRFALANKMYWVLPVVLVSLVLLGLVAASSTPLAPFIYSVF